MKPITNFIELLQITEQKYGDGDRSWTPTTEEQFMYFLDVVPPAFLRGPVFASGEPWRHYEQGYPVYLCFRHEQGGFCEARYASVKELVAEVLPKPEPDTPPAG
jgi:hypothetical protein